MNENKEMLEGKTLKAAFEWEILFKTYWDEEKEVFVKNCVFSFGEGFCNEICERELVERTTVKKRLRIGLENR